ncbi:MAG: hypothetical protein AAFQ66_14205, partial [Pseudomonadota bacterium]
ILRDFFAEQRGILLDVADKTEVQVSDLKDLFGVTAQAEREHVLDQIFDTLEHFTVPAAN